MPGLAAVSKCIRRIRPRSVSIKLPAHRPRRHPIPQQLRVATPQAVMNRRSPAAASIRRQTQRSQRPQAERSALLPLALRHIDTQHTR